MKKITIKHSNGIEATLIVENELDFNKGGIYYKDAGETRLNFTKVSEDDKVIIENYEPRDWVLVAGLASRDIYAVKESQCCGGHVKLQDFLTEKEADELAKSINKKINSYKF